MAEDQLSADLAALRIARDEAPPKRRSWRWLVVVAALLAVAWAVRALAVPYVSAKVFKTEVALTEVALVSPAQATVRLTATGYVVPQVVAKVGAKVTGRITKVNLHEGDHVAAGTILFELDALDQASSISSAQARVAAARSKAAAERGQAQVARANLAESRQQYERQKKLAATGSVTGASVDDLAARVQSLEQQVAAADQLANAADADANAIAAEVGALKVNLGNFTIPAPIDGTAVDKPAQVGDVVNPASTLVELVDFRSLLLEVDVPETKLGQISAGAPCEVVLDAFADKRLRGEVLERSPRLNRAKATGTIKVKLEALDGVLPEMSARVSFLDKKLEDADLKAAPKTIVPASAIAERGGGKVVFVFEDGKVRQVPVTLGAPFAGGFELSSGLAPGTRLIKDPAATLADGQAVKEKGGE